MGTLTDGPSALARALDVLKTEYGSEDYNILTRYCPHPDFSDIEWGRSLPTPTRFSVSGFIHPSAVPEIDSTMDVRCVGQELQPLRQRPVYAAAGQRHPGLPQQTRLRR